MFLEKRKFHCALYKLARDLSLVVDVNFFQNKHGKTGLDGHFGKVSHFKEEEEKRNKMYTKQDVVDAINKGQEKANRGREKNGKQPINVRAVNFEYPTLTREEVTKLQLPSGVLSSCYHFSKDAMGVYTRIFSDGTVKKYLEVTVSTKENRKRKKISQPYVMPPKSSKHLKAESSNRKKVLSTEEVEALEFKSSE